MIKFLYIMGNAVERFVDNLPAIILGIVLLIVGVCKDLDALYFGVSAIVVLALGIALEIIRRARIKKDK